MNLPFFDDAQVTAFTPWPDLIQALRTAFRGDGKSPERHHHSIPRDSRDDLTLLIMPAWQAAGDFGVKLASIASGNKMLGLPTLNGVYVLFDGHTGQARALFDAGALTARRTAAASALASQVLSRADASNLLVIGTGRVARQLIAAHCSVRSITRIQVWGRNPERVAEVVDEASQVTGVSCQPASDLAKAAGSADIITSAVPTTAPQLRGEWIGQGTHIDLVGAFTPDMCEADTHLIARAKQVYVDTRAGARQEAGDLIQAQQCGVFDFRQIAGNLHDIAACEGSLRETQDEITVYKSVGVALQDLAAASLCLALASP